MADTILLELTHDEAGALAAATQWEPPTMSSEAVNNLASARAKLDQAISDANAVSNHDLHAQGVTSKSAA